MSTTKSRKLFFIIVWLLLAGVLLFSGIAHSANLYSLSVADLEPILSDWLSHSGFRVNPSERSSGKVELTAVRVHERWEIYLKARSANTTEVQVSPSGAAAKNRSLPREMAAYLSGYIKALSIKGDHPNHAIPHAVLSQIESVVCIKARRGQQNTQFSGFILNKEGLIICTTHDLETLQEIKVILHDGREFDGNLVKFDARKDLALVGVELMPKSIVSLARGRNLVEIGERVFTIGCPVNLIGTVYSGTVNGPPRRVEELPFWQVNMEIHPGSSGSPVFDVNGRLVGIIKGRYRGTTSIGFVIPLETITSFLKGS
jgi:serine protease Do